MRKIWYITVVGLLLGSVGTSYGLDVPRQRDPYFPGTGFEQYGWPILIKVGQAGFKFLDYPIGARPAAMATGSDSSAESRPATRSGARPVKSGVTRATRS